MPSLRVWRDDESGHEIPDIRQWLEDGAERTVTVTHSLFRVSSRRRPYLPLFTVKEDDE